jgi:hypothetical protein
MSTLFDVPCPDCGQQLRVTADGHLECRGCRETYQLRMGHLFPSGEPGRQSAGAAGATTAPTP